MRSSILLNHALSSSRRSIISSRFLSQTAAPSALHVTDHSEVSPTHYTLTTLPSNINTTLTPPTASSRDYRIKCSHCCFETSRSSGPIRQVYRRSRRSQTSSCYCFTKSLETASIEWWHEERGHPQEHSHDWPYRLWQGVPSSHPIPHFSFLC